MRWRVTFERISEESSRIGDVADSGFLNAGGDAVAAIIGKPTPGVEMTLRQAVENMPRGAMFDVGTWLESDSFDSDGDTELRALHPPKSITPSSYARLKRLLGVA